MSHINLNNISKNFAGLDVIKNVSIDIKDGEFVVFVGPSGCGKSTLLRLIAGLEDISDGTLRIDDMIVNELPPKERGIAMVFQSYALYPHMNVYKNMAFGLKLAKTDKKAMDRRVRDVARILQLDHLLDRRPAQLSGGQRQRVAIGRAIVRNPKAFLFDEPLSNLDAALRVQTRLEIAKLHQDLAATIIYVTHDQVEAMTLADKIVVLNEGQVEQIGAPLDLYQRPANQFVAGFIGSPAMNFLPARFIAQGKKKSQFNLSDTIQIKLPNCDLGSLSDNPDYTLGIRPEHLRLNQSGDFNCPAQIQVIEHLGDVSYIYAILDTGQQVIAAQQGIAADFRPGDMINLSADPQMIHLFDHQGLSIRRS